MAYYLQLGYRGQGETFAELFNNLCGGASLKESRALSSCFPKTYSLLEEELIRRGLLELGNYSPGN